MRRALASPELIVAVMLALVLAALSASSRLSSADVQLTAGAGGSLTLSNSREGSAILALGGMRPGDSADGTVTIGNTGTVPGDLLLSTSNRVDTPGPGGGALSGRLDLVVTEVTNPGSPVTIYSGKLAALQRSALGTLAPGASRTYDFHVEFPDLGRGTENAYQGSSLSAQFDWTATSDGADTEPPETTITATPGTLVASGTASFSFDASEAGSSFECSLDGAPFGACASPRAYSGLGDGAHSFAVRATDGAGNTDASPAGHVWTVDATRPSATMNDPGAYLHGTVTLTSATSDSGSGIASVTYQRSPAGAGSWTAVPASWNTRGTADGLYDLRVVVADKAGNTTASSPVTGRRVDNTNASSPPPETSPPPPASPSSAPTASPGFSPPGGSATLSPGSATPTPESANAPPALVPATPHTRQSIEQPEPKSDSVTPASGADDSSRVRGPLGYSLLALALALAFALRSGLRRYRSGRRARVLGDALEPLVLWDSRLLHRAATALRQLAGRP
jgi:hypothetical protein